MIDNILERAKGFFSDKSILDDLIVEEGISKVIEKIPAEIIEFIAKLGPMERKFALAALTEIINAIIPKGKKEIFSPILVAFNRELNHRVEHHGKEATTDAPPSTTSTPPTSPIPPTAKSSAEPKEDEWTSRRRLLSNPCFGDRGPIMQNNLIEMLHPTVNPFLTLKAINPKEYEKRLIIGLTSIDEESFETMLGSEADPAKKAIAALKRAAFIPFWVGNIEAPKEKFSISNMLNNFADDLGYDHTIRTDRLAILELTRTARKTGPFLPPKKRGFWETIKNRI
jgi:hypothetical protein